VERRCYHCDTALDPAMAVGRRDACAGCGRDLRCCRNCDHYAPGMHNDCRENQAERQVDKTAGNFCDFFRFRAAGGKAKDTGDSASRKALDDLFKR